MERVEGSHEFSLSQGPVKCAKGQPSPLPTPSVEVRVAGEAEIRGSLGECGLMSRGRTRRLGEEGLGSAPSPYLGAGPTPRLESPPSLRRGLAPPPRRPRPRPSLPVPPSLHLVPPSLPPPNTSFSRLPPGAAKFLRSRRLAEPGPAGAAPPLLGHHADPGPGPGPFEPCCAATGGASAAGARRPGCGPRSQRPLRSRPRPHPRTAAPRGPGCGR